jgi:hypothetical protein
VGRNKKILILLLVIWVGILAYHSGIFVGTPVMPKRAGPGPTVLSVLEDLPELRLELLDRPRPGYRGIKKNIFSPLKVHVPKPPPKPPKKSPPKPPPVVVKPPEKDKTVFLNKGEDVFLVKSGDIIDDRFRVAEITDTVLRFNDEVNGDTATLDLETE